MHRLLHFLQRIASEHLKETRFAKGRRSLRKSENADAATSAAVASQSLYGLAQPNQSDMEDKK